MAHNNQFIHVHLRCVASCGEAAEPGLFQSNPCHPLRSEQAVVPLCFAFPLLSEVLRMLRVEKH